MNIGIKLFIVIIGMMTFVVAGVRHESRMPLVHVTQKNVQKKHNQKAPTLVEKQEPSEAKDASAHNNNEQTTEQEKKEFETLITDLDNIQERSQ